VGWGWGGMVGTGGEPEGQDGGNGDGMMGTGWLGWGQDGVVVSGWSGRVRMVTRSMGWWG